MFKTKKIISLFVSLSIMTTLFFDAARASYKPDYSVKKSVAAFEILDNFKIIASSYKPDTPLVIFISDLHSDPEVQRLIYQTLKRLDSDGILSKVFTEGAPEGKVDISKLTGGDYQKRKRIIDAFLSCGLVGGAEAFAVESDFKDIYGIENWDIYLENLKTASEAYNSGGIFFADARENIYANSRKEIRSAVKKIAKIHNLGESRLNAAENSDLQIQNYGEIDKYLKIAGLKKRLNEKEAQKDIYSAFEFLKTKLPYKEFIRIADKFSNSGDEEFLSELFSLLKNRFSSILAGRSALTELLYLNELKYASNPHTLIYQTSLLKNTIIENISPAYDRELISLYFFFELLDKYASLSVSSEEFNDLMINKNLILKTCFKYFPQRDYEKVAGLLSDKNIAGYYENNVIRNRIFYRNIKKNIARAKDGKKAVFAGKTYAGVNVAVMGGFHKNAADLFKEDDISFVSLFPKVKESERNAYKDIIRLSASALAPPLLSAGIENNEISSLIDFWSSFDDIYSKRAIRAVNERLSEKNIPFTASVDAERRIAIEKIKSGSSFFEGVKRFFSRIFKHKRPEPVREDMTVREIIAAQYLKTLDSLNGEMPDIVIICLNNEEDIAFYEGVLEKIRRETRLSEANFKFLLISEKGTGASFVNISEYVNSLKHGSEFKNLRGKRWQDLRICAINIDGLDRSVTGRELPFEFNGGKITPFELSLLNGIRACRSFGESGGLALMSPESVYIGDMAASGEITVITSLESYGDILAYEMPWIISDENGVRKMYYKFDGGDIKDALEKKGILERTRNLENGGLKQFETTTGNILFSFQEGLSYSSFFGKIAELYRRIYAGRPAGGTPEYVDFVQHVLIPLLRMKNGEDSLSYFSKMGIDKAFGELFGEYSSFFDLTLNADFKNIMDRISVKTYMQPYSFYASAKKPVLEDGVFAQDFAQREYENSEDPGHGSFIRRAEAEYAEIFREISNTRLQKKYFSENRIAAVKMYKKIASSCEKNAENIEAYVRDNSGISQNDIKILENLKNLFVFAGYYSVEYVRALDSFENISLLGGYIFPKKSIFEILKIMPFNRIIFGMRSNFKKEKEKLRAQAYKLYAAGNAVSPSLYNYESLLKEIDEYVQGKEHPSAKTYLGMEKGWGDRKAVQRILSLIIAAQSVISTVSVAIASSDSGAAAGTFSIFAAPVFSLCTGIGLSVFLHRLMILIGKRIAFYNSEIKKLSSLGGGHFENLRRASDENGILKEILEDLSALEAGLKNDEDSDGAKSRIAFAKNKIKNYLQGKSEETLIGIKKEILDAAGFVSGEKTLSLKVKVSYLPDSVADHSESFEFAAGGIEDSSREYLDKWKNILNSEDFDAVKFEIARQYALQLIKITAFSETYFSNLKNKEQVIAIIQDFIALLNETSRKAAEMAPEERRGLMLELKSFEEVGEYIEHYYRLLSNVMNADLLNGYRISNGTPLFFLEKFKILTVVRAIMGINFGIHFSEKDFMRGLNGIIRSGNALISGLYDKEAIISVSKEYFDSKRSPKRFDIGISEFWKSRKMLTRMFPLIFFVRSVIVNRLYLQPDKLFFSFITGVGIAVFMHWIPIISGFISMQIKKVKMKRKYGEESVKIPPESLRDKIIESKAANLTQIAYGRMPDIVFISSDLPEEDMGGVKRLMSGISGNGNLRNLKTEYISDEGSGSGNAVIDVLSYMNSEEFRRKYPEIAEKGISRINAVIMHIDKSDYESMFDPIDFPISAPATTPFEISLLNSIGLIQNGDETGNITLANPAYVYLGSLSRSGDVTLLGSDSDYFRQNTPVFISGVPGERKPGESVAKKIYKTFDIEKISNVLLRSSLENILKRHGDYGWQVSFFSGLSSISLDAEKIKYFSQYMDELKAFIENYRGKKFKIDAFSHIIVPYVMLNNGENADTYLAKIISSMSDRDDRREYYEFFKRIFEIHKKFHAASSENLEVNIVHPPESLSGKADPESTHYAEIKTFLKHLKNDGASQPAAETVTAAGIARAGAEAANKTANPVAAATSMTNKICERLNPKTKTLVFLTPNLNSDYITHASASQKAGINSICAAIDGDSPGVPDAEIIANIPVEDAVISAKASVTVNADNSFTVKFNPLYGGAVSDKERDIIRSILSSGDETGADEVRKKIFLSRGMLAFIKEAESGRRDLKGAGKIIADSLRDNLLSVISIDGSGDFVQPKIIDDRFYNDETLAGINFCGLYINKEINGDIHRISPEAKDALRLSEDARRFDIFTGGSLRAGLMSALFADASFLLSFNGSLFAAADAEEYKLIKLDRNMFYADPKQYISGLFELINGLSLKKSEGIAVEFQGAGVSGKITPSLTINTVSDIASLENLADTRLINSVIISNMFAQTENGSVIGNIFNPMLADFRREMSEIGYKDGGFLNILFEEKADLATWKSVNSRFYAAGVLLEYLKAKSEKAEEFEDFKKSAFAAAGEKSFEYITALILSGKKTVNEEEFAEIKSENLEKWAAALEQVKYMEFVVFKQLVQDAKKMKDKGITLIVKINLTFLKDSAGFNEGFFEISNNGEAAVLPQYSMTPENFPVVGLLEYLRDFLSVGGFLISDIDSYRDKERISAYLRKKLQNGLNGKMVLIFEDEDAQAYPSAENAYILSSNDSGNRNIILKTGISDSASVESLLETVKNYGSNVINISLSFAGDAGMKFDALRANRKDILKASYANTMQYYAGGYRDASKNKKLADEAEKITISDEENSVNRITAKGILIFSALYSYIRGDGKNEKEMLAYLSESGALFALARKHLRDLDAKSPLLRYIDNLELKSRSAAAGEKHFYNMQLLGFMNAIIHYKYGSRESLLKVKARALADSFYVKNNFFNFVPSSADTMSLYGLYLGSKNKEQFALKLRGYFKHWETIYDDGKNAAALLWLAEQASLFMKDLDAAEKYEFASGIVSYLNEAVDKCAGTFGVFAEYDALYLNALIVCREFNALTGNRLRAARLDGEISQEEDAANKKYFGAQSGRFNPDIILFFSLSALGGVFKGEYAKKAAEDFEKHSLNGFGGVKNGKAYPYYLYYYSLLVSYSDRKTLLETISFYIEETLTLPEFFSRKDGFAPGGKFRDQVSAAYFAIMLDDFDDSEVKIKIQEKEIGNIFGSVKAVLGAA